MTDSNHEALIPRLSRIRLPITPGNQEPQTSGAGRWRGGPALDFPLEVNVPHAVARFTITVGRFGT